MAMFEWPAVKKVKTENANAYTECEPGKFNAVLKVEGVKLYVIHELLSRVSPVFHKMFQGSWIEAKTKEVTLNGKSLQAVVWLLDYIYPDTHFDINESRAIVLLPLAVEYQIVKLQTQCEDVFRRTYGPTLEMLTLSERFQLSELMTLMTEKCSKALTATEIDKQREADKNRELSEKLYQKLIRERLDFLEKKQRR